MKVLGLDVGEKRIGIAISDDLGLTAQGLKVLNRKGLEDDLREIEEIIAAAEVSEIVVGLPKNMDGSVGVAGQKIMSFVEKMEGSIRIPITLWDERWTTAEATRLLIKADVSRKKRRKVIDKLAAVLILQGYLDSLAQGDKTGRQR